MGVITSSRWFYGDLFKSSKLVRFNRNFCMKEIIRFRSRVNDLAWTLKNDKFLKRFVIEYFHGFEKSSTLVLWDRVEDSLFSNTGRCYINFKLRGSCSALKYNYIKKGSIFLIGSPIDFLSSIRNFKFSNKGQLQVKHILVKLVKFKSPICLSWDGKKYSLINKSFASFLSYRLGSKFKFKLKRRSSKSSRINYSNFLNKLKSQSSCSVSSNSNKFKPLLSKTGKFIRSLHHSQVAFMYRSFPKRCYNHINFKLQRSVVSGRVKAFPDPHERFFGPLNQEADSFPLTATVFRRGIWDNYFITIFREKGLSQEGTFLDAFFTARWKPFFYTYSGRIVKGD